MYAMCLHNCGGWKKASDPLESKLKAVVSCSTLDSGNQTQVFYKSSLFLTASHLFSFEAESYYTALAGL